MYSTLDLQKLVQMLSFLGISPGSAAPPHSVVLGGGTNAAPGVAGTLLASNGVAVDPSFKTLAALGIQVALGYTPAHAGANSDITSLLGLSTPLSIGQGGTGANTSAAARAALGAAASGTNTDITSLASPALGAATATTAARGMNSNEVATTAFVLRQAPFINILDYGGDPTGVSDNSAAFGAALAACTANRVCIYFPPGKYLFSVAIGYTFSSSAATFSILGAGANVTEITFPNISSGITINYDGPFNSVHIRDLSITTGQVAAGTIAISLIQLVTPISNPALTALSDITNVTIRGADGYAITDYWSFGIAANSVSNINFTNVMIVGSGAQLGQGVFLEATGANAPPVVFNFSGCWIGYVQFGVNVADFVQGVTINQCNFFACQNGFIVGGGVTGLDQLTIANSQFACDVNISMASEFQNCMITGNLFIIITNGFGIFYSAAVLFTIVGNTFQNGNSGTGETGIYINNTSGVAGVITGNVFRALADAIKLDTAASGVNVQSNFYAGMTSHNVNNLGTGNTLGGVTGATD
jgi:hypothetical protein